MGGCLSSNDGTMHRSKSMAVLNPAEAGESRHGSAEEQELDMRLAMLPNRVVTAGKIRNAVIHSEQGRKGVNQDTMLAWADFQEGGEEEDTDLIAVFDGHGTHGHLVATRVRDSIGSRIAASWHSVGQMNGNGTADPDTDTAANSTAVDILGNDCAYLAADVAVQTVASENGIPEATKSAAADRWHRAISEAFLAMDREIRAHPCMDAHMSGTAAVMMLRQGAELTVVNLGDSRCVMAVEDGKRLTAVALTEDHKCDLPKERARIVSAKGRVFALADEPHLPRVWVPHELLPGLAMSRSLGDLILKPYGVSAEPEITQRRISGKDRFAVLASDGLWDVMSNQSAVDIVANAPSQAQAAEHLCAEALSLWQKKYPRARRDDCTAAILFFPPQRNSVVDMMHSAESHGGLTS